MNKIILATGADDKYINNPRFEIYLKSIENNSNFDKNILVYLGNNDITINYNNIEMFKVEPNSILQKSDNNCLQHGEFLNSESFNEISHNDIIIFTDGDMTLQRQLNDEEIYFLRNMKDNDVYVGYNASPNDTLFDEYNRLKPTSQNTNDYLNYDLKSIKVYNTGVLCMNKRTWIKLKDEYIKHYPVIKNMFLHYAKQQWLISFLLYLENFNVIEMGYDIHNHTHYAPPSGTENENGIIKYKNKIVLFKHKW